MRALISVVDDIVVKKASGAAQEAYFVRDCVSYFEDNPDPLVVKSFDFRVTSSYQVKRTKFVQYEYKMERLFPISEEDRRFLSRVYQITEDSRHYPTDYIRKSFPDVQGELLEFTNTVYNNRMFWDFHDGNVMKTARGQYKLIDLEGLERDYMESRFAQ